ncbi:DUF3310 domain-containing protein [Staphylococcus chromogenes]|uniref:DUF3310 domain-containing protein n=1 Tax=Staphylococcus chromogenes TaxID=46126 RepID=UPI001F5463F3|nr:DUF3310 domain-containing protein [Staphylococcus chromogenes]
MRVKDLKLGDKVIAYVDYNHREDGINAYPIQGYVREMPNDKRWAKLRCAHGVETINDEDEFELCKSDSVHQPTHYQFGKFSANVIIELVGKTYKSASVFYHVGNALKYLMRAPRKNGLEDLKKAKQSVEFAIDCWEVK